MDSFNVIVTWYALTTLVSLAFTPFAILIFRHLTDRGASFGRILSVLVLAWPAWFLSSFMPGIVPFGPVTLWTTIVLGGIAAWALAIRAKVIDREILVHIAVAEAGYLAMFAAYVWFRGYDPTIMLQEKFSDLMMLSSTMRTEQMPPNDAWLAGETINYYYVGYVPWAAIGKLAGTTPAFAYNLALASVFASTITAAIGVVANVIGRYQSLLAARIAGGLAAIFLVFMATPWAAFTAIDERDEVWDQFWFDFMWPATRQFVGGTAENSPEAITEFPAFSFQLGDLHPHLLALPFTLLALGLAWMLANLPPDQGLRTQWWRVAVAGGVVGGLYAMNSWDFPAYLLLAIGGLVAGSSTWAMRDRVGGAVLLIASSIVAWLPFYVHFEAPTAPADTPFADAVQDIPVIGGILASLAAWDGPATTLGQYTGLFGFAWIVAIALIGWELWARRDLPADPLVTKLTLGVAGVLALIGLLLPMPLLVLAGIPTVLIFLLWQRDASISAANVALALFALGFVLTLVPEFLYLIDIFNNRMNTVFKLYYQAWVMFALGAAIGLVVLWQAVRSLPVARVALATATAVIVIGGVGAAAVGAHQWNSWRLPPDSGWIGMDGLHFLETDPGWAGQDEAVDWLYENARENDVMLSVGGCEWASDVGLTASASGVPAIIGWDTHERQWHLGQPDIYGETVQRTADIETLWQSLDPALLDRYGITLVYIGPLETRGTLNPGQISQGDTCAPGPFANASNPEFPGSGWSEVYTNDDGVRIYRRDDG